MAVTINKTDGTVLSTIQDGAIDTINTNLTLIGRLYRNYGELVNENFVRLLENFANSSAPTTPIVGQIWFNTSTGLLNVYRSNGFVGLATLSSSAAQPNLPKQGDLWFDTVDGQLKIYSGIAWLVVSPQYSLSQTKTGVFAETIRDTLNTNHICLVHYQQNNVVAIQCRDAQWIPQISISGFSTINPGFNLANINSQRFVGTATNSLMLGNIEASRYLRNDINGTIDGSLTLSNSGLTIGQLDDFQLSIIDNEAYLTKSDGRISFNVNGSNVLKLTSESQALFTDGTPQYPSMSFLQQPNSGMYRVENDIIGVSVAGDTILEISPSGLFVNGDIQASNFTGILNADSIIASNLQVTNNTVTNNLQVLNTTTLGSNTGDIVQINAGNILIPNGITFSNNNVRFNGPVAFGNNIISADGVSAVTVNADLYVGGDTEINGGLVVGNTINVGGIFVGDSSGRLTLNSTVATGYANIGDFSMGQTNSIRSYNSPKMWVAFNGTLAGLSIYDSFNIDFVTRTSTNNYTFTTEYPISSGAMAVVGTNGTNLVTAPSIGATSFSITTTSEGTRMALVVLSQ